MVALLERPASARAGPHRRHRVVFPGMPSSEVTSPVGTPFRQILAQAGKPNDASVTLRVDGNTATLDDVPETDTTVLAASNVAAG